MTCWQTNLRSVKFWTGQLADWTICRLVKSLTAKFWISEWLFVLKKLWNISASWPVCKLISPWLDCQLVCRQIILT